MKMKTLELIGKFPAEGEALRASGEYVKITREEMLRTIYGEQYPVPVNFFIANDVMSVGEISVPAGGLGARASEVLRHRGDCLLYCEAGPIFVFTPDDGELYEVNEGEGMFLPEATDYQLVNYGAKVVRAIFAVSIEF